MSIINKGGIAAIILTGALIGGVGATAANAASSPVSTSCGDTSSDDERAPAGERG